MVVGHVLDSGPWEIKNDGRLLGLKLYSPNSATFGVFKLDFDSYERYQDFETGVLHRISSRIYLRF